jgi:hypothetical protein
MSLILADRVRETTQTTGTGTITLDGAVQGFQSFAVIGNNNTTYYTINRGSEWEVGLGTYYGGTLSRDTVYASSNGGSKVNFSAGLKDVFVTYPAEKSVNEDANNRVLIPYTTGTTNVGSLNVGDATAHTDSGVIAGFTASEPLYLYTSLQNTSTANTSYASYAVNDGGHTAYGELGINNSNYSYSAAGFPNNGFSTPLATFVESYGGPLVLGSWDNQKISMIINGAVSTTDAMTINTNGSVAFNGQVGTAGQLLQSNATSAPTWVTPNAGTVTSVSGTGTVSGISLSGTVTSSGNLTLGGTLDLSSPPAIGGTTPSTGTFTTLTAQTVVLKGTGQNLVTYSNTFSSWTNTAQTLTGSQSDPFGGSTATLIVPTTASANHAIYSNAPFIANFPYTLSIYAKASGYSLVYISDAGGGTYGCSFNLSTLAVTPFTGCTGTITAVSGATGWYRLTLTTTVVASTNSRFTVTGYPAGAAFSGFYANFTGDGTSGIVIYGAQAEFGSTANAYQATTTTAVYGTPSLSFSGVAGLGLQSDGSLYVSPAGTGALQAQATTSSAVGGNARGANAVDWQTARGAAAQVASGSNSVLVGGQNNTSSSYTSFLGAGANNYAQATNCFVGAGNANLVNLAGNYAAIVAGNGNTAQGYANFIGGGSSNSGTSGSAVTTQSGTMNGTTAVTLSGSNASIKVGQYIGGTSIASETYVAAISGTSLTLSKNASGSSTSTLSFYTPHGVVVGGGNNQATGSYSFIGGGGDAGTAGNRNVASGDWSFVGGGIKNTASGNGSVVVGGGYVIGGTAFANTASGSTSAIVNGQGNTASGIDGFIGNGYQNTASGDYSAIINGVLGTTRSIVGNQVASACNNPLSSGATGTNQSSLLILGRQTTDATATVLTSNTSAASGTNQVILPNNSAYYFRGEVVAGVTGAGDTKGWYIEGVIKRGAGVGTTAIVGTATVTSLYADVGASTWAVTALADTTNGGLKITVTGQASTTIRWVAQIRTTEMTY